MREPSDDTSYVPDLDEVMADFQDIRLSPEEHQRIKDLIHGAIFHELVYTDRSYLVVGAGGDSDAWTRRTNVVDSLDTRRDAMAIRLEDFGLTGDEARLWARLFDLLCGSVTYIVGVFEDFRGGYVWEFGLLFSSEYRGKVWVLKRRYEDVSKERDRYDNAMAISHVQLLLTGERAQEWRDTDELRAAVESIP